METIFEFINQNIEWAPYIIFGALLLAGFNIPVSEDGMLFISALLASKQPEQFWMFFFAVYLGAYISDIICFFLGKKLGPKLFEIKFFSNMVSMKRIRAINAYYDKYGPLTLILGRFIPFGVRNGLFLTAGIGQMNSLKFAISDLIACTISCTVYFYLYYTMGEAVISYIKQSNQAIFVIATAVVAFFVVRKILSNRKKRQQTDLEA